MPEIEDVNIEGMTDVTPLLYDALKQAVKSHSSPRALRASPAITKDGELSYTPEQIESRRAIAEIRKDEIANESAVQDKQLRLCTAVFLAFVLVGIVVFQSVLLWYVGKGSIDFVQYPWLVDIVVAQNFAQVVGLAYLVVNNLFPTSERVSAMIDRRVEKAIEAKEKSQGIRRGVAGRKVGG